MSCSSAQVSSISLFSCAATTESLDIQGGDLIEISEFPFFFRCACVLNVLPEVIEVGLCLIWDGFLEG